MTIAPVLVVSVISVSLLLGISQALTCQESGSPVSPSSLPIPPYGYVVEVEANIIDKGYTAQAKFYYSYSNNAAAVTVFSQGADHRYIFSYYTDEIFTISGTDCSVSRLKTSTDVYSTWLLGWYKLPNGQLHVNLPQAQWFNNFTYGTDYGLNYIENTTVRGVPVDHWQTCGKWQPNRSMMIDYYFTKNWTSASTWPRVPVRVEIMGDKQLSNGSLYTIHHVYDFFNFKVEEPDSRAVFQTPVGVICPGRKNTKSLPKLPQRFYVRTEVIYEESSIITHEDIWYDAAFKYYRRDYRPLTATYPTFSYNPLTEIHDYYIGARYVIDKGQGNCTTLPLSNTSSDVSAESINGSYVVHLRNPLQLFNLDWNYTYIGQVVERGVLCDVFVTMRNDLLVTMRSDLIVFDMMANSNTTITFYFLASGWDSYDANVIEASGFGTPVKMILQDDIGPSVTYNYVDFTLLPMLDIYDISVCYPESHKLKFQVRFEGVIQQHQQRSIPYIKDAAHMMFAEQMGVAYLRIQQLSIEYDDAYTYISATLLDKTPPTAQFEYIPGKVIEKQDDSIVYNIYTPFQCAGFCINNQNFTCNSFDFCSDDHSCRLSRAHIGHGKAVVKSSVTCDHFSRSVNGVRAEPSIQQAYNQMRMKIYNKTMTLPLNMGQMQPMAAVDLSVSFGWLTTKVELPSLPQQLHYRIETIIPATQYTAEGEVWYDMTLDLMRYDTRYTGPMKPFRSMDQYSIIDDFSTGLQYTTDKNDQKCTIRAIPSTDFGAIMSPQGQRNSTWSIRMKNSYELLHIDDTYKFVGQQTVRGKLCNVFESLRTDYTPPEMEGNYQSVFRYFFTENFNDVSDQLFVTQSLPVRLEITVPQNGLFIEYNIYDYDHDRPDVSIYDIHDCFNASNRQTFQITFAAPFGYYPQWDEPVDYLRDLVIFAMSRITTLPPLRFQRTKVDWDANYLYVTTTMVGDGDIPNYFTHIINGSVAEHVDKVVSTQGADTALHCAQMCFTGFVNLTCNSFYFCPTQKECLFSRNNAPSLNGPKPNVVSGCESYSRTVTSRDAAPLTNLEAFTLLKNSVYLGKLQITNPGAVRGKTYTATMVDTLQRGAHYKQSEAMQHFIQFKSNSKMKDFDSSLTFLSLDDCALACTSMLDYQCQGFTYCDGLFTCTLAKARPELLASGRVEQADACYIYQRNYLDDYMASPGTVSMTTADSTISSVTSSDNCAKQCTQTKSLACQSFEYCPGSNQCLLFNGWALGNVSTGASTSCKQFKRSALADFHAINGGTYVFNAVVQYQGVSVTQCSQLCVEQQGSNCHGFYFCDKVSACHLTSAQPGQPQVRLDSSSQAVFCNYYTRLGINNTKPGVSSTTSASITSRTLHTTSKTSRKTSASTHLTNLSSRPSSVTTGTATRLSPSSTISKVRSISTSSSTPQHGSTTVACIGATQKQTGGDSNNMKSGSVVGIAFATFIIGLVIGVAAFFVFNRYRSKQHDEIEMHLTKQNH